MKKYRPARAHFSQSDRLARTSLSTRLLPLLFASATGSSAEHTSSASSISAPSRPLRPVCMLRRLLVTKPQRVLPLTAGKVDGARRRCRYSLLRLLRSLSPQLYGAQHEIVRPQQRMGSCASNQVRWFTASGVLVSSRSMTSSSKRQNRPSASRSRPCWPSVAALQEQPTCHAW